jgi:hypothetical protein
MLSINLKEHPMSNIYDIIKIDDETEVVLTQDAYLDGTDDKPMYRASARDIRNGDLYRVTWDVLDGGMEHEDESDRCDWTQPEITKL